ncbi:PREDICTED: zinc finger BED domain-containing protein 1-like [Diuraphis noxia]|uniref:zinc finger BED domain-containing protein 1-like n=1 Tax=Diuraphis noxia TaxID=143948 RepID=UPI000763ADA2|nr:PREDICTED: zinc finger BED domain-containing protein 1-like [Diuraphis noxia]
MRTKSKIWNYFEKNSTITSTADTEEVLDECVDGPLSLSNINCDKPNNKETKLKRKIGTLKQSKLKVISPLDKKTVEKYKHAIGIWMFTDMEPYNSVERKGFKHLLSVLCPNFELPSRKYFSDHKIPQMYEIVRNCLKEKLKQVSNISLTTDYWTSVNGYPFIGLAAHTINNYWKIESFCLACTSLNVDHNNVNIKNKIKEILIDWEIDESKIAGITTDCGSNILKAVESLSFNHVPCFGHVLNTGVTNAFALPPVKLCSESEINFSLQSQNETFFVKCSGLI